MLEFFLLFEVTFSCVIKISQQSIVIIQQSESNLGIESEIILATAV